MCITIVCGKPSLQHWEKTVSDRGLLCGRRSCSAQTLPRTGLRGFRPPTTQALGDTALRQQRSDAAIVELAPDSPSTHGLAGAHVGANSPFLWLTNLGSVALQSYPRRLKGA